MVSLFRSYPLSKVSDVQSPLSSFQVVSHLWHDKALCLRSTEVITHILSHLPPSTLSAMSLVSTRFHNMVTTPHAWRIAFSRFFPCQDAIKDATGSLRLEASGQQILRSERRSFSRLSALASWRSEYILRTRLLRSLGRGKPAQFQPISRAGSSRYSGGGQAAAVVTYSSNLVYPVSHIHATFGSGLNKKIPFFMHGASEYGVVTVSDPSAAKVTDTWGGNTDYSAFRYFEDSAFAGEAMWGHGAGDLVGVPNPLDLSHGYGRVYGEGLPDGRVFFTPISDRRGVFLTLNSPANHDLGIPDVNKFRRSVCTTWIVKSERVLKATNGIFGLLAGYSNGILAAYSIGANPAYDRRFENGEPTAKWALSPGVPIIALQIDENISSRSQGRRRIWAVALNALGEVFYLTEIPSRPEAKGKLSDDEVHQIAWQTGRSVPWTLIESTRRISKPDPFKESAVDGSYSPRSSSDVEGLSKDQLNAETKEIEKFLSYRPNHFQKICEGWDMRRKLIIDFASGDHFGAGESIFVLTCGFDESRPAAIRRYVRHRMKLLQNHDLEQYPTSQLRPAKHSIFGNATNNLNSPSRSTPRSRTSSHDSEFESTLHTEWRLSDFTLGGLKGAQISASATDDSHFAVIAAGEDPLLGMSGGSNTSSPLASPLGQMPQPKTASEIPGQRARFLTVGTASGVVLLWNMRATSPPDVDIINCIVPLRTIYTESPQISCLALTSLYLVHGGNDGLVQAWDPLASSTEPIRTLNSRFSSRARRRLIQAEASLQGVGNNYYAAGAVVLDPDPTVLRGMVSLGTHLRYWSYSSCAADQYQRGKRRLRRRSERGSNVATNEHRFTHTGRGVLKDYIANEKQELEREKVARYKEYERMSGRFGTDLLGPGASEEEILAYATMLSEESYTSDEVKRRGSGESSRALSPASSDTVHEGGVSLTEEAPTSPHSASADDNDSLDPDVAEAIRLSLMEEQQKQSSPQAADISIRYSKNATSPSLSSPNAGASHRRSPTRIAEEGDLDFALQLSLAEEQSRQGDVADLEDEFPALASPATPPSANAARGKGKGKGRQ